MATKFYNPRSTRHRVYRVGKYILPRACLLPPFRTVPAPRAVATFAEAQERFPDRVHSRLLAVDQPQPAVPVHVIDHGRPVVATLEATTAAPVMIHSVARGGAVGRACCLVGPEGTAILDPGFGLDRGIGSGFEFRKLDPRYWIRRRRGDLTSRMRLPEPEHVPGRVVVLNNWQAHNYYHWLVEVAPRAAAVHLASLDVDGYLVDHQGGYQRHVLEMLGIPSSRWIQPHAGLHLTADELLWVSQPGETLLRHFITMLEPAIEPHVDPSRGRRIAISRRKAAHRRLTNEQELERALHEFDFEIHCFEDVPLHRQMLLMREASVVVTVHGAALANAMFARPGTSIIEIYPQGRSHMTLYPFWSRLYGFKHSVVIAACSRFGQRLTVPVDDVVAAVRLSIA